MGTLPEILALADRINKFGRQLKAMGFDCPMPRPVEEDRSADRWPGESP